MSLNSLIKIITLPTISIKNSFAAFSVPSYSVFELARQNHSFHFLVAAFLFAFTPDMCQAQENEAGNQGFHQGGPGQVIRSIDLFDEIDAADDSNLLNRQTEAVIIRALNYLKQSQDSEGRWEGNDSNWVAFSSFSMIAFMLNGHFPNSKLPYGPTLSKSLDAILEDGESRNDGYIGSSMYAHGLATLCLSEVWGHTDKDERVRKALKAAVNVILRSQSELGGWRYNPWPGGADVSVTAMQVIALAAARQAGIFVPDATVKRGVRYLNLCHHTESGGFTYLAGMGEPGFARTAAATFSMMMLGKHDAPEVKSGVNYIKKEKFKVLQSTPYYMYGHYYAALVMYQAGPDEFEQWYPNIRDILLARQADNGSFITGSGKVTYDTALAALILSIPYGYVPAYQR